MQRGAEATTEKPVYWETKLSAVDLKVQLVGEKAGRAGLLQKLLDAILRDL